MKASNAIAMIAVAWAGCSTPSRTTQEAPAAVSYESAREAVLRAIAAHDRDGGYFVAYCVSVVLGEVAPAATREARVGTAWGVDSPDASPTLLSRLSQLPHRFLPASECMRSGGDYDIVLRATKAGPALLVGVGPVQVVSAHQVEIVVFTTSGYLTETATAFSLRRRKDGGWYVEDEAILLQV